MTFSRLWEKIDATPTLAASLKDTLKQKGARGNELTLNPSLAFNRPLTEKIDGTFDYGYTKNYSKDEANYQYSKHEVHFGASYRF